MLAQVKDGPRGFKVGKMLPPFQVERRQNVAKILLYGNYNRVSSGLHICDVNLKLCQFYGVRVRGADVGESCKQRVLWV